METNTQAKQTPGQILAATIMPFILRGIVPNSELEVHTGIATSIDRCINDGKAELLAACTRWVNEWVQNPTPAQRANNYAIEKQIQQAIKNAQQ